MFELIFLILFSTALTVVGIYCFAKKKFLYLFIPCMLFLPTYYGIELSISLPLITVTRMMYCYFYIYAFINRRRKLNFKDFDLKTMPKEFFFLAGYFLLRIVSNLYYVTRYSQAINTIFLIIFEQLLLLWAVYLLAPTKEEIVKLIKVIVWAATALFVIGIFESISSIRIFDALYTVSRTIVNMNYVRLGLLRATTTLNAPAVYGNMCVLMVPLILYLYELTGSKKYLAVIGLDILAIIHSGSRSDMLFVIFLLMVYAVFVLKGKERRILFVKNAAIIMGILLVFICSCSLFNDDLRYFYTGNVKSVLNEVGFEFDLDRGAPTKSGGFGNNAEGSVSRTRQFSGIYYTATINPIFGLGSAAQRRGDVKYGWPGEKTGVFKWHVAHTYDLGVVEIFCDEGLIGLMGICSLLIFMLLRSKNDKYGKLALVCYLLTTLSTGNMFNYLMMYVIVFSLRDIGEMHK